MKPGETSIKALVIGAVLALALGPHAEARTRVVAHNFHRNGGLGALRAIGHDRNIRSGDHFGWRQGDRRT